MFPLLAFAVDNNTMCFTPLSLHDFANDSSNFPAGTITDLTPANDRLNASALPKSATSTYGPYLALSASTFSHATFTSNFASTSCITTASPSFDPESSTYMALFGELSDVDFPTPFTLAW